MGKNLRIRGKNAPNYEAQIFGKLRTEKPNPKQIQFFTAAEKHVCYGGARGGGKSWAMRRKLVMLCMTYDGLNALLLRRTMPELRQNHIIPLMVDLNGYASYKADERSFIFPNGSRLRLGYCACDADQMQYQGQENDVIGFEEATNFSEEWITFISTSLRSVRPDFKPRIYYTANPGGVGHNYIKRLFIDRQYRDGEKPKDYRFIPATVYDNNVLMDNDPGYIQILKALPEAKRRAHLDGDWTVFSGQVFAEFRDNPDGYASHIDTHVIDPVNIPAGWNIYRGFDWGYSKPWAAVYFAFDYDDRAYMVSELYGCTGDPDVGLKMPMDDVFGQIASYESERFPGREIVGIADPAIWAKDGGPSIYECACKHGIYFQKGKNNRLQGWQQLHNRLKFDENGVPMLYVFKSCRNFIRTLPMLIYDPHKPEDIDTTQEDHLADAARYVLMSRPYSPQPEPVKAPKGFDPLSSDDKPSGNMDWINF